ncbi:MAG: UvrD-helicase domain-containing protein [Myxococcaceae bacterium]
MSDSSRIVIAGAGTGKTYALVQAYLENLQKYKPYEILAITFTQKAAAEMRARVIAKALETGVSARGLLSAPICTFHALCAQIVGDDFGEFELLSPGDDDKLCLEIAEQVILEALEKRELETGPLVARFQIRYLAEALVSLLQQVREAGDLSPSPSPETGEGEKKYVEAIEEAYVNFKNSAGLSKIAEEKLADFEKAFLKFKQVSHNEISLSVAFRDMRETLTGRFGDDLLRTQLVDSVVALGSFLCAVFTAPEADLVRDLLLGYATKIDAHKQEKKTFGFGDLLFLAKKILTNQKSRFKCVLVDEYQDTSPIQEQLVALLSRDTELFIVGDPKQSIYGFRGADATVFDRVSGERESLTLSRRSQGAVIDLVNLVAYATLPGFNQTHALEALHEHQGQAGGIWKTDWALQVKNLIDTGRFKPEEIVILVRRIKAAAPMLSELQALGVPARIYGGDGFYARQEIFDLAAALFILIVPENPLAKLTLLRSPLCALADSALIDWQDQALPELFDELRASLGVSSVAEIIDRLLLEGGYVQAMAVMLDPDQCLANALKLRLQFVDSVEDYELKIRALWEKLDNPPKESLAEPFDGQQDSVVIMTMHQSKGLEFPAVILADLASTQPSDSEVILFDSELGLAVTHKNRALALCAPQSAEEKKKFPTPIDAIRQKARAKAEAELPRLLYVALTRAKEAVFVIDLEVADRGVSLMRLFKQARSLDPELFEQLMPTDATIF